MEFEDIPIGGLSVSPDRQSVTFPASVSWGYDLKLIEHFR